jgi:hypothetical protein
MRKRWGIRYPKFCKFRCGWWSLTNTFDLQMTQWRPDFFTASLPRRIQNTSLIAANVFLMPLCFTRSCVSRMTNSVNQCFGGSSAGIFAVNDNVASLILPLHRNISCPSRNNPYWWTKGGLVFFFRLFNNSISLANDIDWTDFTHKDSATDTSAEGLFSSRCFWCWWIVSNSISQVLHKSQHIRRYSY